MAALTKDKIRDLAENVPALFTSVEVVDNDIIYVGAFCGEDTNGRARPLQAGDDFLGLAEQQRDMVTPASLSAGDKNIRLRQQGIVVEVVTGVSALTNIFDDVYAASDNDLTLTAGANTKIGKVVEVVNTSTGLCKVFFQALAIQSI